MDPTGAPFVDEHAAHGERPRFEDIRDSVVRDRSLRSAELEACLAANPNDDEALSVYADWLISHGDARGHLMRVQSDRARCPDDAGLAELERRVLTEFSRELLGPLDAHKVVKNGADYLPGFRWKNGFVRAARLWRPAERPTLPELLRMLFDHPAGCLLEHLVLSQTWWGDAVGYEEAIDVLMERRPKTFRSLQLAESADAVPGNVERALHLPGLKRFRVHYQPLELGSVGVCRLEELALDITSPAPGVLASFESATWPELSALSVGADLLPAMRGVMCDHAAPNLRRLTVVSATNAFLRELAISPLLERLEQIELWWARELDKLSELADKLRRVPRILLQRTGNWATTPLATRLRTELPNLIAFTATQEPDALDYGGAASQSP